MDLSAAPLCPELCAVELETDDLAGGGVSTSAGTGSDVEDQALGARLVRFIAYYEGTIEELRAECAGAAHHGRALTSLHRPPLRSRSSHAIDPAAASSHTQRVTPASRTRGPPGVATPGVSSFLGSM